MTSSRSRSALLSDATTPAHADGGVAAARLMNNAMLQALQTQQSLALLWLGVSAEMTGFLLRLGDQQAKSWTAPPGGTGSATPFRLAGASSAALEDYLNTSSRVIERSSETGRQIAGIWTRQADEVTPVLGNGARPH